MEVFERGRKGRKDLELLIWALALRFEPHNTFLVQKPTQSCSHRAESRKLVIPLERRETFHSVAASEVIMRGDAAAGSC